MDLKKIISCSIILVSITIGAQNVNRGATESSVSKSEYFSWINNTNEGTTEQQTLINLDFFQWLRSEYGMQLDIYAMDAGVIDSKNIYGNMKSGRFYKNFPNGFRNIADKSCQNGIRLGLWGGPDGFGNTSESAEERKQMWISLCRDYNWGLFKFDAVCGPLRPEKIDDFVDMMQQCRNLTPDLVLLNHRLGLEKAEQYATTFLWEGRESYIDVNSYNTSTAIHHRVGAMSRGLVPGLQRLTEDHGVCLSSCLDYWDDELILQAFNRSLILSPQIYGNPWLLRDSEFPKLARIFNLHRKYADILVNGMTLPSHYGISAVARGDDSTRLVTLRNLSWSTQTITIKLDDEIGLKNGNRIFCKTYHPTEKILGEYSYGDKIEVNVLPFRSLLLCVSADKRPDETEVLGTDYMVEKDLADAPMVVKLLGYSGDKVKVGLTGKDKIEKVIVEGKDVTSKILKNGVELTFPGKRMTKDYHRWLADLHPVDIPQDKLAMYEATAFAASNNALEVSSLYRSGETGISQVKKARDAFFNQPTFINRSVWDKNLFDGNPSTMFAVSKIRGGSKIKGGCFRLDLGSKMYVDSIRVLVNNEYMLQPLLKAEGNYAFVSSDLKEWKRIVFEADTVINIHVDDTIRYLKMNPFPEAIAEIEVYANGEKLESGNFHANNLMADGNAMKCTNAWGNTFELDEWTDGSYLCVAINGKHEVEGAYAVLKVGDEFIGASSRAVSYPVNPWENRVATVDSNYTYFFTIDNRLQGKSIEVFVLGYNDKITELKPEVWITAYPVPYKQKEMIIYKKD